jgi:hypothetical protein
VVHVGERFAHSDFKNATRSAFSRCISPIWKRSLQKPTTSARLAAAPLWKYFEVHDPGDLGLAGRRRGDRQRHAD